MSVWRHILDDEALGLMMSDGPQSGPLYDFVFDRPEATFAPWTTPAVLAAQLAAHGITATPTETFPLQETSGSTVTGSASTVLTAGAGAYLGRKALGLHDGNGSLDSFVGPAFKRGSTVATLAAGSASTFDKTTASFAILFLVRLNGLSSSAGWSLVGKATSAMATGWDVEVANTGRVWIRAADGSTEANVQLTGTDISDGAWHYICAIWDRTAPRIRLLTDFESVDAAFAIGSVTSTAVFEIGRTRAITSAGWQCAGLAMFDGAAAEALNDKAKLDAWFAAQVNGTTPKTGWTFTRASVLGAPLKPDSTGERLHIYGKGRPAFGYGSLLSGTQLGYFSCPLTTNLLSESSIDRAWWTSEGSPTVTADHGECPRGLQHSYRIVKTGGGGGRRRSGDVALTSGTVYTFSVWFKSSSSLPSIWITDSGDTTTKATATAAGGTADGTWRRLHVTWTADATANFKFHISPSVDGNATGNAEFQYAMLHIGADPMPFVPTYGTSAGTSATVLSRAASLPGMALRGALLVTAQGFTNNATGGQSQAVVSIGVADAGARGIGTSSSEVALCYWFNDAGAFQAQAAGAVFPLDLRTITEYLGQWGNSDPLLGTKELHVRFGSSEGTFDTTLAGTDPTHVVVGSRAGASQHIGPIQRVRIYRQPIEVP